MGLGFSLLCGLFTLKWLVVEGMDLVIWGS